MRVDDYLESIVKAHPSTAISWVAAKKFKRKKIAVNKYIFRFPSSIILEINNDRANMKIPIRY